MVLSRIVVLVGLLLAVASTSALSGALAPDSPPKEKRMSLNDSHSRVGQATLQPILFEGKRYKEILNGQLLDLPQRTGLMMIIDEATNARLGVIKIYEVPLDSNLEADVQDVFFTAFELDSGKREIRITNERKQRFVFRIDDKSVQPVP